MIHNVSSISDRIIKPCKNVQEVIEKLIDDIKTYYDEKPIVLFCDEKNQKSIIEILMKNNFDKHRIGTAYETM